MNYYDANAQPCWFCKKSCGGCKWSSKFEPIPGWIAEPTVIKQGTRKKNVPKRIIINVPSYKILECPEFIRG